MYLFLFFDSFCWSFNLSSVVRPFANLSWSLRFIVTLQARPCEFPYSTLFWGVLFGVFSLECSCLECSFSGCSYILISAFWRELQTRKLESQCLILSCLSENILLRTANSSSFLSSDFIPSRFSDKLGRRAAFLRLFGTRSCHFVRILWRLTVSPNYS